MKKKRGKKMFTRFTPRAYPEKSFLKIFTRGKKASVDPLVFIVGALTIIGGILYMVNQSWGMLTIAIALLVEAVKQVMK